MSTATQSAGAANAFGDLIRQWRAIRRFSQLDLSLEAAMSARHLSFLESGRARPSRSMVLKLSEALEMPKEIANQALNSAGFSPAYPQFSADDAALGPVRDAVRLMLANHDPLPGIVIDRHWDIIDANNSAVMIFQAMGVTGAGNFLDALGAMGELENFENWAEVALLAIARIRSESAARGGDRILDGYVAKLAAHPRLRNFDAGSVDYSQAVIPSIVNIGGARLSMFSTIAQFGSVQDVIASDIRIELMFPADEATADFFNVKSAAMRP